MEAVSTTELGHALAEPDYVRDRLTPRITHMDYLALHDLSRLVRRVASEVEGRVFDYGAGGAPYRPFFRRCSEYVAADISAGPRIDKLLLENGLTSEYSESCDFVLSTQVLEHVKDPSAYVAECHRILKPSGRMLLTTHGMFEEHGCPYDFHRWTSQGLENLIVSAGFNIVESYKLTTEIRALVLLLNRSIHHLRYPNSGILAKYGSGVIRRCYRLVCGPMLNVFAGFFDGKAMLPSSNPVPFYIGVGVLAQKADRAASLV